LAFFHQLTNAIVPFYYLIGSLQTIKSISTNKPIVTLLPTSWVVFMGMLFELLADLRRWKSDKRENKRDVVCTKVDSKS